MSDDKTNVPAKATALDFGKFMEIAVTKGDEASVAALEKISALYMKLEDRNAQKEYFEALSDFQDECPDVPKNKTVKMPKFSFRYADLQGIRAHIRPYLRKCDLSVSWGDAEIIDGGKMRVECTCRHIGGGSGSAAFTAPVASNSPGMSDQQKAVSTNTVCQRQSLINVLGLTTCDEEIPSADGTVDAAVLISDSQVADLRAALTDLGDLDAEEKKLCKYAGVKALEEIAQGKAYTDVVAAVDKKRKALAGKG